MRGIGQVFEQHPSLSLSHKCGAYFTYAHVPLWPCPGPSSSHLSHTPPLLTSPPKPLHLSPEPHQHSGQGFVRLFRAPCLLHKLTAPRGGTGNSASQI